MEDHFHSYSPNHSYSCEARPLTNQIQQRLLVMAWDNLSSCGPFKLLKALGASEPCWVVASKPALRDTITPLNRLVSCHLKDRSTRQPYILDNMAMVANEEKRAGVLHIDLHANQSCKCQWVSGSGLPDEAVPSVCPGRWCRVMP